ncbi:MAG: RES family NAD+ phosphorylase, partial [Lamprobacter sp.]|uniref:RES family NAD+ phosphorylase n=1 Tax=Lamprobacter sp. TaxID=3100796 RepID=UPI002B256A19
DGSVQPAIAVAMALPAPPVGGHAKLRLLAVPAGQRWYRITHRRHATALHCSTTHLARWNDPRGDYGVLYVADAPATAFAETFGHNLMDRYPPAVDTFVSIGELDERALYRIHSARALLLAQLTGCGLAALNLDAQLLAVVDYALPQAWSRWIFEAPQAPDGILYPSRALPGATNLALFSRCAEALVEQSLGSLWSWRSDTGADVIEILDEQGWGLV